MNGFPERLEAAVIGAGPAGMGAAVELYDSGIRNLAVFERNHWVGGVLPQCIHTGFGLDIFGEELTGPQFARKIGAEAKKRAIPVFTGAMVTRVESGRICVSSREFGLQEIDVPGIILASGCRERTRENLEIPGTRPAGIFTAGQAQTLINLNNLQPGRKIVIQGSGDIGLIMARRLRIEGADVTGVYERLPWLSGLIRNKVQCLDYFNIPLHFSRQITRIIGRRRVEAVEISRLEEGVPVAGTEESVACDTVLFSVGLIPELELADGAGAGRRDRVFPETTKDFQTGVDGLFVCGNSLHINELADNAWLEGRSCGKACSEFLKLTGKRVFLPGLPFRAPEPETRYTEAFFEQLEASDGMVCIVCPRGCLLKEGESGCKRGEDAWLRSRKGRFQRLSTTVMVPSGEGFIQLPAVSLEEVDTKAILYLKKELERECPNLKKTPGRPEVYRISVGTTEFEVG